MPIDRSAFDELIDDSGSGADGSEFNKGVFEATILDPVDEALEAQDEAIAAIAVGVSVVLFSPLDNQPPASSYATPDVRNGHPVLDFDGSSDEEAVFSGVLPSTYQGGGLTVDLFVAFTSATSGDARWQVAFERIELSGLDLDADSFAAFQSAGVTAPGTSGHVKQVSITFDDGSEIDGLSAGEPFRVKVRRDADGTSGTDDITTDAELVGVTVRETPA